MPALSRGRRHAGRVVFALLLAGGASALPVPGARADEASRVVVLGFDGADARLTEQFMAEGDLPHLAALRDGGTYAPLGTTTPPQTPVSWSSFATGMNPARNGIFDFLRRDLATYQPDFAMYAIGSKPVLLGKNNHLLIAAALLVVPLLAGLGAGAARRRPGRGLLVGGTVGILLGAAGFVAGRDLLPYRRPTIENVRRGVTFWELAGEHGIRSCILRVPATFPPRGFPNGEILAGLGVPDIRGTMGTFSFYTTAPDLETDEDTEMGGKIIQVSLVNGETDSYLYGPRNKLFDDPPEILPPVHFKLDREASPPTVTITTARESKTIALREWSDWFTLEFTFSPVIKVTGIARFYLVSSEPFGLYLSAINLDPHRPVLPVSAPPALSSRLADRFGLYKTLGWGMDTWALNEERIDEETFLQDAYFTEEKFAELMRGLLDDGDTRLFVHVYELTDRVAHMFWRLLDPEHPAYDAALAARHKDAVRDTYRFMDRVVGEVRERLGPDDVLLVLSDHGFHTWHKSVNYNTWLVRNGYMTLKGDGPDSQKKLEDLFGQGQFWPNVDWARTKAYAMGLGDVYLNVKGREAKGIVEEGSEYERIRNQLIAEFEAWIDPENGEHPVRRARKREDVYGENIDRNLIPDLLLANSPKYRVSWQTSLGGIPPTLLQVNDRKWSGDHCSLDADITKGILFSNRRLKALDPTILDLFPTILGYLGVSSPDSLDGTALKEAS
jgi:predicted AlkP superfamily phosphohydrolase/phosphomutase